MKNTRQPPPKHLPTISEKQSPLWIFILVLLGIPLIMYWQVIFDHKYLWDDFRYLYYPQHAFAVRELLKGVFPAWNPYSYGGTPFLGDIQTALFYPINLLYLIVAPQGILNVFWCQLIVVLHLGIAGIGQFFLVRHFIKNNWISFLCALIFMLSAQMALRIVQPVVLSAMVYVPLIYYLSIKSVSDKSPIYAGGAVLALGTGLLAGYPQFILIGLLCLGPFIIAIIFSLFKKDAGNVRTGNAVHRALLFSIICACGLAISSIQVLPSVEFSKQSNRENWSYESACENSLRPDRLITTAIPNLFGKIEADVPHGFWINEGSWTYWEQGIFFSACALTLLLFGLPLVIRQKRVLFTALSGALILWISLGKFGGIYYLVYTFVPFFDRMRGPSKFIYIFCIFSSLSAAFVLDYLRQNHLPQKKERIRGFFIVAGVSLVIMFIAYQMLQNGVSAISQSNQKYFLDLGVSGILVFVITVAVTLLLLFLYGSKKISFKTLIVFSSLLVVSEFLIHFGTFCGSNYNPYEMHAPSQVPRALVPSDNNDLFRVNTRYYGDSKFPGTLLLQRNNGCFTDIFQMEGLAPLVFNRMFFPTSEIMKKMTPEKAWGLLNVRYMATVDQANNSYALKAIDHVPRAYFVTQYLVSKNDTQTISMLSDTSFKIHQTVVLEKELPWKSHPMSAQAAITISDYRCDAIKLQASVKDSGVLILTEYFYPDWHAYVNGKPVETLRANYNVRALALVPGEYAVEFKYGSSAFKRGRLLAIFGCCVAFGLIGVPLYRLRKKQKEPS